jgi:hypothetical protein
MTAMEQRRNEDAALVDQDDRARSASAAFWMSMHGRRRMASTGCGFGGESLGCCTGKRTSQLDSL